MYSAAMLGLNLEVLLKFYVCSGIILFCFPGHSYIVLNLPKSVSRENNYLFLIFPKFIENSLMKKEIL